MIASNDKQAYIAFVAAICLTAGVDRTGWVDSSATTWSSSVAEHGGTSRSDEPRRQLRLEILEVVTKNPGVDAEEVSRMLRLPFHEVDDLVAEMCSDGLLAPA